MNLNVDKEVLRSFLLGTLEAEPRAELEEGILCNPAAYEEILLLEEELIDQYVAGRLSKEERQQFETYFLITTERQKKLRFGQLLKRYLSSQAVPAVSKNVPVQQRKQTTLFRRFFARLAFVVIVVAVLAIGLLGWLALKKPVRQQSLQQDPYPLVVVPLSPASEELQGITPHNVIISPQGFNVKLELAVANTSFKNYKSELFRENKPLQTDALIMETKGEQRIVPLTITGETLSPGEYQLKLSGVSDSGQDEFIDHYSFRVTK
ncbi:MAG TPA: hypothetical protein VF290_07070 [Pyrinomonadaceae bacterium]